MTQMSNNTISMLLNAMQNGGNPMALLQQMAGNDPTIRNAMQIMRGKSPTQLRQTAENLAANQGTTIEEVARSLGISIPSNR